MRPSMELSSSPPASSVLFKSDSEGLQSLGFLKRQRDRHLVDNSDDDVHKCSGPA
jgi:hypothetical protein